MKLDEISTGTESTDVAESTAPTTETTAESTTEPSETVEDFDIDGLDTSDLEVEPDSETDIDDDVDSELEDLLKDDKVQQFDRKYVENINNKAAATRVAFKPFKEAFSGFDEDQTGALLGLMKELSEDPESAAGKLVAIGNSILGTESNAPEVNGEVDIDKPMTMREWQEYQNKQAQDQEFNQKVQQVYADARDLGYQDDTLEQRLYLGVLANEAGGDKEKADKLVKSLFQAKVKEYIADKRRQAELATGSPTGLSTETESHSPSSWDEAYKASEARLRSTVGQ